MRGIDGAAPIQNRLVAPSMSLKMTDFCNLLRWFPPIFFSQHQAEQNTFAKQNFATANPPQPAELPCLGRAWMAHGRKRLDGEDKVLFCKCVLFSLVLRKNMGGNQRRRLQKSVIFRDIDGATNLF